MLHPRILYYWDIRLAKMSFTPIFSFGSAGETTAEYGQIIPAVPTTEGSNAAQAPPRFAKYTAGLVEVLIAFRA